MKVFFVIILTVMELLIIFNIIKARKCEGRVAKVIVRLLSIALFTIITQICLMVTNNKMIALIAQGLYFLSIDWILICMLHFVQLYTEQFEENNIAKKLCYGIAALDTASFVINIFTNHVFDIDKTLYNGVEYWMHSGHSVFFNIHLVFTYVVVAFSIGALLVKTVKIHKMYKKKYLTVLVSIIIAIILNGVYMIMDFPFDISIILYSSLGTIICYYSLFFQPKDIIESTLSLVVEDINDAIICFDVIGDCVYLNKTVYRIFNNDTGIIEDLKERLVKYSEENKLEFNDEVQWAERMNIGEKTRYFNIVFHKLFNKKREYIGCFYTISDRTKEIEDFKEEHYRMTHDKLTGVYTREYFFELVEKKLRSHPDEQFYMVCSSIKGFKIYNDLFGEKQGDEILKMEAELLMKYSHESSLYGRISGAKFAVLVHKDIYAEDIFLSCIDKMKERFDNDMYKLHIHAGAYLVVDNTESASLICDKSRFAIEALGEDFNTIITYYDSSIMEKSIHERQIISEFESALEEKQFVMFLQPQISSENTLRGAEALVRWQHPERGLVFPGDFIEVLEKSGLIYKLDRYIWERAAECLAKWKQQNMGYYISVNISIKDFEYLDIYREMTSLVEKYDIDPKRLKLEITETVFMNQKTRIMDILNNLRSYGFIVEMDDFGSGYSSLNMLKDIDVDVVKIDMGFMRETGLLPERQERSNFILKSMIELIKQLGMEVITEGVETKVQVDNVTSMGCNLFQGYFFDKPMSLELFEEKYMNRK